MAVNLVAQTAFLGDIILTTPLIRAVKTAFPDDELYVLTTFQGTQILSGITEIDGFIDVEKDGRDFGISSFFSVSRDIRKAGISRVFACHRSYRTGLLLSYSRIPERIGFSDAKLSWLLTARVPYERGKHAVERYLSLTAPAGLNPEDFPKAPFLAVNSEKKERILESLLVAGIQPGQQVAVVCPGSVWPTKEWIPEKFIGLIERMYYELGITTILAGGRKEKNLAYSIQIDCAVPTVNVVGKTSIRRLVALIDRADILITNDSGPMHIGAALKKPQVAIFGPTTPSLGFYPYNRNARIVERNLECRPCNRHGPQKCPLEHFRCMNNISVEDVFEAVHLVLAGKK